MNTSTGFTLAAILSLVFISANAVTVYQCVDANGDMTFQDSCPPGTTKTGEKQLKSKLRDDDRVDIQQIARENPVTLYAVQDCDACDLVRAQLERRAVPFTERDVSVEVDLPEEVQNESGQVTVPTVTVAEHMLTGYNKGGLDSALDGAGYPNPQAPGDD